MVKIILIFSLNSRLNMSIRSNRSKIMVIKTIIKGNVYIYLEETQKFYKSFHFFSISLNRIPCNPGIHYQRSHIFISLEKPMVHVLFDMLILIQVLYALSIIMMLIRYSNAYTFQLTKYLT